MGGLIFLAPIAGLIAGIIGFGVVSLFYMLKLRRRPVSVSSTLLWSRAVRDMEGNVPWQRITPTVLFFVHLLIVLLLALAIARPVFDDSIGRGDRVYIVIDTSASMSAVVDGQSGIDLAKEHAIEKIESLFRSGRTPTVSVIEAGADANVLISDSSQRGRLIGVIRSISGTDQPGSLLDAIELIESIQDAPRKETDGSPESGDEQISQLQQEAYVYVLSDGGSIKSQIIPFRNGYGESKSPFSENDQPKNVGIVAINAARDRSDPVLTRVFVRLERSSVEMKAVVLKVFDGEQQVSSRAVSFDDQSSINESFELRLSTAVLLRVEIANRDALESDNSAWVRVPDPSPVRITLVAPNGVADPLLVDMLEVVGRTKADVIDENEEITDSDLVVFDRVGMGAWVQLPSIGFASLYPDQTKDDQLDTLGNRRRMLSWDRSDSMVRDSTMGSVSYQRSIRFPEESEGVRVIAVDRDGSVIVERTVGVNRHLSVAFSLHDSNWAVQVGFPIFLVNAIEHLLPGTSGLGDVFSTLDRVESLDSNDDTIELGPFDQVGEYELGPKRIGVSLLNSSETELDIRDEIDVGYNSKNQNPRNEYGIIAEQELWRWFTFLAMLLIAVEGVVYAAKVRVRL
ncbi:MAG: VWA domain-containing protein [Phycisphaerales bacterium]|nr:VWA domain-containing protein [Phycisphaerales bacterium]